MKFFRDLIVAVALGNLSTVPALAQSRAPVPATAPATNPLVWAVRTAPDASSAIDAYAHGFATGRVSAIELEQAFVRRMAELGAPELANAQAHTLINRGAADATIKGIAAYNDAARGDARAAIANLRLALTDRPDDPFLLRTAAQVVAWHDWQAGRVHLPKGDVAGIEWLRSAGKGRREFADTYRIVTEARQQPQTATGAATAPPTSAAPTTQASTSEGSSGAGYGAPAGYGSAGGYGSKGYPYSYDYPYYGYYWSAGSILTLRDQGFHPPRHGFDPRGLAGGPGGATPARSPGSRPPRPPSAPPPAAQPRGPSAAPRAPSAPAAAPRTPSAPPRRPPPPRLP